MGKKLHWELMVRSIAGLTSPLAPLPESHTTIDEEQGDSVAPREKGGQDLHPIAIK